MIHVGDCLEVMRTLDANSVDAIVTDPPYGIGFMGKGWDHDVPGEAFWREALRVAKPGAYLAAFGGTRKYHRLACYIEDAGWELRDSVARAHNREDCEWLAAWVFGSGFPKSHNGEWGGTALKPAWEPIILARKPLIGTVEANWREHGTGALNIDGCRVSIDPTADASQLRTMSRSVRAENDGWGMSTVAGDMPQVVRPEGRWPANLIHDGSDEAVACFPQSDGQAGAVTGNEPSSPFKNAYGDMGRSVASLPRGDSGSAARFFYCAKASREDRNDGCGEFAEKPLLWSSGEANPGSFQAEGTKRAAQNNHPTVKPTDLMRWLCRLVTPPGGLILDPFTGSGSTGRGAILEGFRFTGIELDPDYAHIAEARIAAAVEQRRIDTAQFDLFAVA